jgi:hypothetical protein
MPLLKDYTILLTVPPRVGDKVKVAPAKAKEGKDQALTIPLKLYEMEPLAKSKGSLTTRVTRATRIVRDKDTLDGYFRQRTQAERHHKP